MNEVLFSVLLIVGLLLYVTRDHITNKLNKILLDNSCTFIFKKRYVSYLSFIIISTILIIGMLYGTKTKQTFKNVSQGFEKIKNKDDGKPHPLFDIDTYW